MFLQQINCKRQKNDRKDLWAKKDLRGNLECGPCLDLDLNKPNAKKI